MRPPKGGHGPDPGTRRGLGNLIPPRARSRLGTVDPVGHPLLPSVAPSRRHGFSRLEQENGGRRPASPCVVGEAETSRTRGAQRDPTPRTRVLLVEDRADWTHGHYEPVLTRMTAGFTAIGCEVTILTSIGLLPGTGIDAAGCRSARRYRWGARWVEGRLRAVDRLPVTSPWRSPTPTVGHPPPLDAADRRDPARRQDPGRSGRCRRGHLQRRAHPDARGRPGSGRGATGRPSATPPRSPRSSPGLGGGRCPGT